MMAIRQEPRLERAPKAPTGAPLRSRGIVQAILVVALAGYVLGLAWSMQHTSYDVWGAVVLAPILLAVSVPLATRIAVQEGDPALRRLIIVALILKLIGAIARYYFAFSVYGGNADAGTYDDAARLLAPSFRAFRFDVHVPGPGGGTAFLKVFTGGVYALIGPTRIGGFLIFSWIGFWGLYFFYRAFRIGFPAGDARRYGLLVFLLPSMLFWPSGIGKEALITFTLGLSAYGAAWLYSRRRGASALLALGLSGTGLVRSHIAVLTFAAVAAGYLLRRTRSASPLAPLGKAAGLAVLFGAAALMAGQFKDDLKLGTLDFTSVQAAVNDTQRTTTEGGSRFDTAGAASMTGLPRVFGTLMFRPFPFEAHNLQAAFASAEGTFLLALTVQSRKRLGSLWRHLRTPYVAMAVVFTILFCFAYSGFGNFGLIARQRVQLFPFVLVLLALPAANRRVDRATGRLR